MKEFPCLKRVHEADCTGGTNGMHVGSRSQNLCKGSPHEEVLILKMELWPCRESVA